MRRLVLLPLAALAGCASPCDRVNAEQDDPAMHTCVFSAELHESGAGSFSPSDGAPFAFVLPTQEPWPDALPDGSRVLGRTWVARGETPPAPADSLHRIASVAVSGERYALGMQWTGEVRLSSGDSSWTLRVAPGEDPFAARVGLSGWPNHARYLTFAQDGSMLIGADTRRRVTAWDAQRGTEVWTRDLPEDGSPTGIVSLSASPDGARVAVATSRALYVLGAASGESAAQWTFPDRATPIVQVEWTPDGAHLAARRAERWVPPTSPSTLPRTGGFGIDARIYLLRLPA